MSARMVSAMAAMVLVCVLLSIAGQSAAQAAPVDPALLAKANSGDAAAQVRVGESFEQAAAAEPIRARIASDYRQAAAWYRKAADQGYVGAQGTLGMLYSLGLGVPQSDAEAYFWLDLAASVKGPNQARYAANRQNVGANITIDQLQDVQDRVAAWQAAHPPPHPVH